MGRFACLVAFLCITVTFFCMAFRLYPESHQYRMDVSLLWSMLALLSRDA
jgi:hypothetical protein